MRSYVAMHVCYRAPDRFGAVVCVGDIPDYLSAGVLTGCFHRVYNLEWTRFWTNNCTVAYCVFDCVCECV